MQVCLSEVTTLLSAFAEDVVTYSGAGWPAMEVWLTKLETHLEKHSLDETKRLLDDKQIRLVAASYQGGLLLSQGEARKLHFEHFRRRLEMCQQFGIRTLLVVADFNQRIDSTTISMRCGFLEAGCSVGRRVRCATGTGISRSRYVLLVSRHCA